MLVSAVVPTLLRPSLIGALQSIRSQRLPPGVAVEIVLVVDLEEDMEVPAPVMRLADEVLFAGGIGGAAARNLGIQKSRGDYVALLDDDDEWQPDKVASQLELATTMDGEVVVSCRVVQGDRAQGSVSPPLPGKLWDGTSKRIEDYLFARREPSIRRASIYTSTLLVSASLAKRVTWTVGLERHQDWDWLMKLMREKRVSYRSTETVGVNIWMNSAHSISAGANWRSSLRWIESWSEQIDAQTQVDFIAGQPLRYAAQSRSIRGVFACVQSIGAERRVPHAGPLLIGLSGILPRKLLTRLALGRGKRSAV